MSVVEHVIPRAFFKRTRAYIKEGRIDIPASQLRTARCRGDARAALRRQAREKNERWRQANIDSAPFRFAIIKRIVAAAAKKLGGTA